MFRKCEYSALFCSYLLLNIFSCNAFPAEDSDTNVYFPPDDTKYEGSACEASFDLRGMCLKLKDCAYTEEKFKTSDLCSFDQNEPIYCCPVDAILSTEVRFGGSNQTVNNSSAVGTVKVGSNSSRPNVQICDQYYPDDDVQKELANQDAISQPSYLATIGWTIKKSKIDWKCVGVFISNKTILTDARCVNSKTEPPNRARILLPDKEKSFKKVMFNIVSTHTHPDYKSPELYNNLALVTIDSDFPLAKPACLWPSADVPNGSNLVRLGYSDSDMKNASERNISLIPAKDCMQGHVKTTGLSKGISPELFCSSSKDRCQRGPGGVVQLHSEKGRPYIAGIASLGSYCKDATPAVYIRLSSYLDWIEPLLKI